MKKGIKGRVVMIDPKRTSLSRAGEIGKVIMQNEMITVEFADGKQLKYQPQSLLTLHPKKDILDLIITSWQNLPQEDVKEMLMVHSLLTQRRPVEALKKAIANTNVRKICVTNCEDLLKLREAEKAILRRGRRL